MLKKIFFAGCLLVISTVSQAGLISHHGYERDSASNIVRGGGLEWLMWDVTKGMSINMALSAYSSERWSLATNVHMTALFNAFQFGKTDWIADETKYQSASLNWTLNENSPHNNLIALFGSTVSGRECISARSVSCYLSNDKLNASYVRFGSDGNKNGGFNSAEIRDDYSYRYSSGRVEQTAASAVITNDWVSSGNFAFSYGVALVRSTKPDVAPVSSPASMSLLALGLCALGLRRRHLLRR